MCLALVDREPHGHGPEPAQVLTSYRDRLDRSALAPSTRALYLRHATWFLGWLAERSEHVGPLFPGPAGRYRCGPCTGPWPGWVAEPARRCHPTTCATPTSPACSALERTWCSSPSKADGLLAHVSEPRR